MRTPKTEYAPIPIIFNDTYYKREGNAALLNLPLGGDMDMKYVVDRSIHITRRFVGAGVIEADVDNATVGYVVTYPTGIDIRLVVDPGEGGRITDHDELIDWIDRHRAGTALLCLNYGATAVNVGDCRITFTAVTVRDDEVAQEEPLGGITIFPLKGRFATPLADGIHWQPVPRVVSNALMDQYNRLRVACVFPPNVYVRVTKGDGLTWRKVRDLLLSGVALEELT